MRLTEDELAARKRRNLWIALGLVGFIVLVFLSTVLRLHQNIQHSEAVAERSLEGEKIGPRTTPQAGSSSGTPAT